MVSKISVSINMQGCVCWKVLCQNSRNEDSICHTSKTENCVQFNLKTQLVVKNNNFMKSTHWDLVIVF